MILGFFRTINDKLFEPLTLKTSNLFSRCNHKDNHNRQCQRRYQQHQGRSKGIHKKPRGLKGMNLQLQWHWRPSDQKHLDPCLPTELFYFCWIGKRVRTI